MIFTISLKLFKHMNYNLLQIIKKYLAIKLTQLYDEKQAIQIQNYLEKEFSIKIKVKEILILAINNLIYKTENDIAIFYIDPDKKLYKDYTIDAICKLITYGTVSNNIVGYPILATLFQSVQNNLLKIYIEWKKADGFIVR